ncbi:MAG: histone deacetylase [Candidatus Bathyarchaeota archaeon]|nr:MAG: histone deacetylase [Candidatus Bathyarchaeota archaeon]
MKETGIVYSEQHRSHKTGRHHPESRRRLRVIMDTLRKQHLFSREEYRFITPKTAQLEDLQLVHSRDHIELVKQVCNSGGGLLDLGDTIASKGTFTAAAYAVGSALSAVDEVVTGRLRNAFALTRPPGHHAGSDYAMGFCIFNNVSIAASYLATKGFQRILILDIDAHHGNGTQDIFYNSSEVLYVSLHEDPREFPGVGFDDEVGRGEGLGFTVNVPFPLGTGDSAYLKAMREIVAPITREFTPQFILLSAGFDGYFLDPVGRLNLSHQVFSLIFQEMLDLASEICEDRLVAVLEGGYYTRRLGQLVLSTILPMAGKSLPASVHSHPVDSETEKRAEKVVERVKKAQSEFWDTLDA